MNLSQIQDLKIHQVGNKRNKIQVHLIIKTDRPIDRTNKYIVNELFKQAKQISKNIDMQVKIFCNKCNSGGKSTNIPLALVTFHKILKEREERRHYLIYGTIKNANLIIKIFRNKNKKLIS